MSKGSLLLVGVSLGALSLPVAVSAQEVESSESEPSQNDVQQTAPRGDAIIVTARRRDEMLQDVPIAVSAISQETAAQSGITGIEAVTFATPNLQFNREISQGATPFLRGVGSPQASAGGESPVAVYLDGVYIGSPNGNMFEFNGIESVQVLKGPQGTLFGRNATGGGIQVTTRRPSHDPEMELRLGYGNYDTVEGSVYASTGLSDNLAINVSASGRDQSDGFGRSLITGNEIHKGWDWSVRSQLLWEPSDTTSILLIGDYGEQRTDLGSNNTTYPGTVSVAGATHQGRNTQTAGEDFAQVEQGGVSLRIDHETSFADLVSISAYRETKLAFDLDQDMGIAPLVQVGTVVSPTETITQEFQIVSNSSSFDWIVGAFYMRTETGYDPSRVGGVFFAPLSTVSLTDTQTLNSYSAFGEVTFEVLPNTNLTLGLRYTVDDYELDVEGRVGDDTFPLPGNTFTDESSFDKLTYRAILDHAITPDILAYASYSRGFRSGGYSLAFPGNAANPAPVVAPEVLDSYEIGLKTEFFNGDLTLNGAAFYYDYQDLAISFVQPGGNLVLNAAGARITGLDLDFVARPFEGFRISGGIGILDTEYTDFPNGPFLVPNPATCTPVPAELPGPRTGGNLPCTGDLTGNTTIRAPEFTLTLAPSYTFETSIGAFTLAANYYHNSGFFWDVSNRMEQPSYDVINGSLTWETLDENLSVRLWAKNLNNEFYGLYSSPNILGDPFSAAPPRTYGVTATVRFGG